MVVQSLARQIPVLQKAIDELERKKVITDAATGLVANYDYVGPTRVTRREYVNNTRTDYAYDGIPPNPPGDFGVKQIIETIHSVPPGGEILDARTYTWDQMYNKTQRKDVRLGGPELTHDYAYDDIYRLVHSTATEPGARSLNSSS